MAASLFRPARAWAALVLLVSGCAPAASPVAPWPAPAAAHASTEALYARAIANAALYQPENVLPLFAITPDSAGQVRVVTITTWNYAPGPQPLGHEVWVTAVPEVRDSCAAWDDPDLVMRMRQLLGLRPADSIAWAVEMTVPVASLFRPTADPSVTAIWPCPEDQRGSGTCGLHFPAGTDTAHVTWMANQMLSAWTLPDGYPARAAGAGQQGLGYPWTRLGYTYNWHPGSPRYGASEYLVRPGTQVTVQSIASIPAYCGRA
jgi:hypothetical protein